MPFVVYRLWSSAPDLAGAAVLGTYGTVIALLTWVLGSTAGVAGSAGVGGVPGIRSVPLVGLARAAEIMVLGLKMVGSTDAVLRRANATPMGPLADGRTVARNVGRFSRRAAQRRPWQRP